MDTFIVDADICPGCERRHGGGAACTHCGLRLHGPQAVELWQASLTISTLLQRRAALIEALYAAPDEDLVAGPTERPQPSAGPPSIAPPRTPARPRAEWTARRVQNVLLALGAFLLAVAALIFTVVTWGNLGVGGRAAILLVVTAATGAAGHLASKRGLTSTAEAIATLGVALLVVDAVGLQTSVAGLRGVDDRLYWAGAAAVIAAVCAAYAKRVPVQQAQFAALGAVQVSGVLVAWRIEDSAGAAAALLAQTALSAYAARRWHRSRLAPGLWAAAALTGAAGVLMAGTAAWVTPTSVSAVLPGAAALVGAGVVSLWVGWQLRRLPVALVAAGAAAAIAGCAAVVALVRPIVATATLPAVLALTALAAAAVGVALGTRWGSGARAAGAGLAGLAIVLDIEHILVAAVAPFVLIDRPWTLEGTRAPAPDSFAPVLEWQGQLSVALTLGAAAVTFALVAAAMPLGAVASRSRWSRPSWSGALWLAAVAATLSALVVVLPVAGRWSYRLAIGWELAVVAAAGAAAIRTAGGHRRTSVAMAVGGATILIGHALPWSLLNEFATHAALTVAVVVAATVARAREVFRPAATGLAAAALLGEVYAGARSAGAGAEAAAFAVAVVAAVLLATSAFAARSGWRAPVSLPVVEVVGWAAFALASRLTVGEPSWAFGALLAGAFAAGVVATRSDRMSVGAVAAALSAGTTWAGAIAVGASAAAAGLAVTIAACGIAAAGWLLRARRGFLMEVVAAAAYVAGTVAAAVDDQTIFLSLALAAGGLTCFAVSLRAERRALAYVGWALLTGLLWLRLWEAAVTAPEPYVIPPALVALGIGWLRRRRSPALSSWAAYGTGLALGLEPTLVMTLRDPGLLRPLLLGAVALAVVLVGAREHLQAPLVIGGATLAFDALVQTAPVAAALPRWVSIACVGVVLMAVGATYEQRLRDLRRLQQRIDALD